VHVGLAYTPEIVTMAIDTPSEVIKGQTMTVSELKIIVEKSRGMWAGPVSNFPGDDQDLFEVKPRFNSDGYDTISLKSREERIQIQPSWNQKGQVRIVQRDPLPLAILAIVPEVDLGG